MGAVSAFSYLVLGSSKVAEWQRLCETVLGASTSIDEQGVLRVRVDERPWRWEIHPAEREELIAIGWEASDPAELSGLIEQHGACKASPVQCLKRNMRQMVTLTDPDGTLHEIGIGPVSIAEPLVSPNDARFVTQGLGFGHAAMFCRDLDAMIGFVTDVLGMKMSDTIRNPGYTVYFYRCNPRHHSLALVHGTREPRIHHLMLQVEDIDTVGRASGAAKDAGIYVRSLGRHTNDHMFSFYCRTPSGFDIEYGWGGLAVDDETWTVFEHVESSIWGHIKL